MRLAKLNPGLVPAGTAISLSKSQHDGKTIMLDTLTGSTITLPAALGTQCKIKVVEKIAATSNSHVIKVQNITDVMIGGVTVAGTTTAQFAPGASDDTITMNRTTTGGATKGAVFEFEDIAAGFWHVSGQANGSGAVATPFSATV